MLTNRPEFHVVDTGVLHTGATPFSIYNTLAPEQIAYLFGNAGNPSSSPNDSSSPRCEVPTSTARSNISSSSTVPQRGR